MASDADDSEDDVDPALDASSVALPGLSFASSPVTLDPDPADPVLVVSESVPVEDGKPPPSESVSEDVLPVSSAGAGEKQAHESGLNTRDTSQVERTREAASQRGGPEGFMSSFRAVGIL